MTPKWFDEAKHELAEAAEYYLWEVPGLDEDFVAEVGKAVATIAGDPMRHREFDPPYRRLKTRRFPYQIIYAIEGGELLIVAVMHQSREPGYWKDRLGDR